MKELKLFESIINLTWLGIIVMILLMGTTLFTSFTHKKETETVIDYVTSPYPKDSNIAVGKTLFRKNCAACHNKDMKSDLTGPALGGVTKRWSAYPISDLKAWIRNSGKLINEKHPRAIEIWKEWGGSEMNSFTHLTDENIDAILEYIER